MPRDPGSAKPFHSVLCLQHLIAMVVKDGVEGKGGIEAPSTSRTACGAVDASLERHKLLVRKAATVE